jgi:BirA family biotin operon repressor/biotin-[acetyl-CoA-carboxylase] ligase
VLLGHGVDREALLASYLIHYEQLYDAARAGASPRDRWRSLLVTLGQRVAATERERVTEGIAEDVDSDGTLLIRTADGTLAAVEAGDVTLRG